MPLGTEVWWTQMADGREWIISQVATAGRGSEVTLILQTNRIPYVGLPRVGRRACFSELNTQERYEVHLPQEIPWTHRPKEPPPADGHLEHTDRGSEAA
jgi:hypothetical protein